MSEILGFAAFLGIAFALAVAILWTLDRFAQNSPIVEPEASRLDTLDHRPADATTSSAGRCTNCRTHPAYVWVLVHNDLGGDLRKVCHGCLAEGTANQWWRAQLGHNATVYDIAAAIDAHDIDQVERFANGDAS